MKRLLVLLLTVATIGGCVTNPHTGRTQVILYSEADMVRLGVAAYAEMTGPNAKVRLIRSGPAWTALQRVGTAIRAGANKPGYKWEFRLIDNIKTANAWALPGGKIAFYTGIYPILQDEAGMAIVMGHEIMHALLRHSNERMSQGQLANVAMVATAVGFHNHKNRDEIVGALGAGLALGVILPYSRLQESEADKMGLFLAARAGYDPEAAIGVWERMDKMSQGKRPPEFLSTHPEPKNRIKNMRQWMPEANRLYAQSAKRVNRPLPRVR